MSSNSPSFSGGAGGKLISNYKADNIFRKPIDLWGFEGATAVKPGNTPSLHTSPSLNTL